VTQTTLETISTVIPTRNRPDFVSNAVRSALNQTYRLIEVIVVIDGPDPATVESLDRIADPRLRVITLPTNLGAANARNVGVASATGTWIAFLDDDDEWLPLKLELQLELAARSTSPFPIISSRFLAHTANGELIWPRRLPFTNESIGEYLFVRNSLFLGETFVATPTLLIKKQLLDRVPLNKDLTRHEDFDWLVRVDRLPGVKLEFVPEPMAIVNVVYTKTRPSLSNTSDWKDSLDWIRSVRHLLTRRAYSACLTTVVSSRAASQQDFRAFLPLLWEAIRLGKPRLLDISLYLMMWLIPQDFRQKLRFIFTDKSIEQGRSSQDASE
jgi:glycosyltransferase involved in cell wall biosynthesis